jgi:hypothetical protein
MHLVQRIDLMVEQYERLLNCILSDAEKAMARISRLEQLFDLLSMCGVANQKVIVGSGSFPLRYAPREDGHDSDLCFIPAIRIPGGIGTLQIDSETMTELAKIPDGIEASAWNSFVPLSRCPAVIKQFVLPQIDPMLTKLFDQLPVKKLMK